MLYMKVSSLKDQAGEAESHVAALLIHSQSSYIAPPDPFESGQWDVSLVITEIRIANGDLQPQLPQSTSRCIAS